jgi:hypothetical protein
MEHEVPNYARHQCCNVKVKLQFTLQQAIKAEGKERYSFTPSLTSALDRGGWSTPRPGRFTSVEATRFIVQEAAWASEPVWTGAKI